MRKRRKICFIVVLLGCCVALSCLSRNGAIKSLVSTANYVKTQTTMAASVATSKASSTSGTMSVLIKSPAHASAKAANVGLSPLLTRLNATQIKEYFEINPLTDKQIPLLFPKIDNHDFGTVAIYSRSNWLKLRAMLTEGNVTLFINGGSSLTGAGMSKADEESCQYAFAQLFRNMSVVDRAHGGCTSFYAAQLMHSYFPRHADVLLWEFAINDVPSYAQSETERYAVCRNQMIHYLDQLVRVSRLRQQDPPIVIILYLWDEPFSVVNGRIAQTVFQSHRDLVERYDFVAGHVSAGQYFQSWNVDEYQTKAIALADDRHPNFRGHQIISYLLKDFIMNAQRPVKPRILRDTSQLTPWTCNERLPEQQAVQDLLIHRYPVASFTEEMPKNGELLHGTLTAQSTRKLVVDYRKKVLPLRRDRKRCVILPCCHVANITFDTVQYGPLKGMQVNWSGNGLARVFMEYEDVTNLVVKARNWPCASDGNWWGLKEWLILQEERNVSQLAFCNFSPDCGMVRRRLALGLMSFALYGGKRE